MPIDKAWLAQIKEETLEPELPICDPHHHLWDHPESRYLLADLLDDTESGHNIVSTVFVECLSKYQKNSSVALAPVGETHFVQRIADASSTEKIDKTKVSAAIVGFADLLLGDSVEEVLTAHINASPNRFRGIRHACGWDTSVEIRNSHTKPPPQLYLSKLFRKGFSHLADYNLTFDTWLYHTQLEELLSLARSFPNQAIVLNHVGGPLGIGPYKSKRNEIFKTWQTRINQLAKCENMVVKLGGLAMPINGFDWHKQEIPPTSAALADAIQPYILHCIERFGPTRCMFESNFPVDKVSCSYNVLWNSFKRITAEFSVDEKNSLFHDTATNFYSIKD